MFKRLITLDNHPKKSFFLWGMRQSGKSTLLREHYKNYPYFDLLKSDVFARYAGAPSLLREEVCADSKPGDVFIIDEVQKIPALLDEIHWLIENRHVNFVLCGSSARKLKRGAANLLGGRALRRQLHGLVSAEIGSQFSLEKMINFGTLPSHYLSDNAWPLLAAYTGDYLKEEVSAEGLVRNLPVFSNFLSMAALCDTEPVNYSTIARDVGVSSQTIKDYYQILTDTLIGSFIPLYKKRAKRRIQGADKFYFHDVGVVNFLAKRKNLEPKSELFGKAFENWLAHELMAFNDYKERFMDISYWKLSSGAEVDFVINDLEVCIEAKATSMVNKNHLKGLESIKDEHPNVGRRIIVSLDSKKRLLDNQIEVYPWQDFVAELWSGKII